MNYDEALTSLLTWAERDPNVRAMVMTGSAAAGQDHPLSDRDIEIYAEDPDRLLADDSWWNALGEVLVVERLTNPDWYSSRLVYYVGGKFDFTLAPITELPSTVYSRPLKVLLDKDGLTSTVTLTHVETALPGADEFNQCVHWAYAAALMCAKLAVRDEPWAAKYRDLDLKTELLRMVEWDHRARYGADFDTRYLGTRMGRWMDDDVRQALNDCCGRFNFDDTSRALMASVRLFANLAERTAQQLGLSGFGHDRLLTEIEHILELKLIRS